MTRYLVTGRGPDPRIDPYTNVPLTVGVGSELNLTLSDPDEATLIAAGVLQRLDLTPIASAASITVEPGFNSISGTATVTDITALDTGDRVTLLFAGAATLTDGSNLKLASNFTAGVDDTITLVCDGTNWYEEARSANA